MAAMSCAMSCCGTTLPLTTRYCLAFPSASSCSASMRLARVSFNPLPTSPTGLRRRKLVVSWASEEPFDANKVLNDALKDIQEAWDKTEDKLVLGTLGFLAFLTLWASAGVISAMDKLPLLPSLFELVGVFYSTWFVYRYLLFKPDREELQKKAKNIWKEITGSKDVY